VDRPPEKFESVRGGLFLWLGRALVVGPGIDSTPHAHYAIQLTFGLDHAFRVRLHADSAWVEMRAAVFAPNQPHQLDCGGNMLAHLFIEAPQRQQKLSTTIEAPYYRLPEFAAVRAALEAARAGTLDLDGAGQAMQQWLACASPAAAMPEPFDPRIGNTLAWLAGNPGTPCGGAALAERVHLSESRFTHLFRQQTGMSLSRYLLWARLLDGVAAVARGDSVTQAAHRAGFADLAHMSRSFRSTFGVAPSELQKMTIAFKQGSA
jgi:AraC family transcriptional regulator